jgi:signal transduction histidine kinase
MIVALALVTGLAWWDERREAQDSLRDLEAEQTMVAVSLAASLRSHLTSMDRDAVLFGEGALDRAPGFESAVVRPTTARLDGNSDPSRLVLTVNLRDGFLVDFAVHARDLLGDLPHLDRPGERTLLLAAPNETALYAMDGRLLTSPPLRDALDRKAIATRLERPQAAEIGLPERTAIAGLAYVDAGALGQWGVAVVASAARERDREKRAQGRLLLSVLVTSGLVLAFGGVALRKQRKELRLARELAASEVARRLDEQLAHAERIATTGTFAMGIAHEVSTPLGVIMGRTEQIVRLQTDERTARHTSVIFQQIERIQEIIRRFLDLARGGHPTFARQNPSEIARAAVNAVSHRFAKAAVSLAACIPPELPSIQCDRALIERAIVNLLLNACEACPPGGHVGISVCTDEERAAIVVTDDGMGISIENAAQATQPFFTTKPVGSGTGLGLAIAAEIAKSHRGELTIVPLGSGGTRACIEIPVAAQEGLHASS